MPLNLTGQKVFLRPLKERDLPILCAAYEDLDTQLTTDGDAPPMSESQVKTFWNEIINDPGPDLRYFAIEPLTSTAQANEMVGACSLQHIDLRNRHAELGIFMTARDYRGQGYGTDAVCLLLDYAFDVVRLDKVHLGVYDFNERGIRAYERVGFRYEGRLRQMIHYEGRYWDEWPMRILRNEWERYRQPPAEGLRLYHPDDLDPAIDLIQQLVFALPDGGIGSSTIINRDEDREAARTVLRRWWRQIDREVYAYQVNGTLVALLTLAIDSDKPIVLDVVGSEEFREALQNVLATARA